MRARGWLVLACVASGPAGAQSYRVDDQPVVQPPAQAQVATPFDPAPRFERAYRRAGRPRMVLLWNRAIDDQANETRLDETVSREQASRSETRSERRTQGPSGSVLVMEGDGRNDLVRTHTHGRRIVDEGLRKTALSERVVVTAATRLPR